MSELNAENFDKTRGNVRDVPKKEGKLGFTLLPKCANMPLNVFRGQRVKFRF